MNTGEYISSGILESYALGFCNLTEAANVEQMCMLYPEIKAELDAIQSSLNNYASVYAREPDASVKAEIFKQIDELEKIQYEQKNAIYTKAGKVIPLSRYLAAASIVLLGLSIIGNIIFYSRWKEADEQIIALNNEKRVLADNLKANEVKLDNMNTNIAVLSNPDVTKVMMKGLPKSPESLAVIYWNKNSNQVYIDVKSLPEPTSGKQYQLWAIVDGKPVDAGMLPMNNFKGLMIRMKDFAAAQAFAITLENAGGSASPTMDEMIVLGAI